MKKAVYCLVVVFLGTAFFPSCVKEESFDEKLLIGKWVSGTLYYKYNSDGTGATWDTSDDVTEEEAQEFEWTLIDSELRQLHIMEMGPKIPKTYTVTELTTSRLRYKDSFGKEFSYSKVN